MSWGFTKYSQPRFNWSRASVNVHCWESHGTAQPKMGLWHQRYPGSKTKVKSQLPTIWKCSEHRKCKSIETHFGTKMILQNELSITRLRNHVIWHWENSCGSAQAPESSQRITLTWSVHKLIWPQHVATFHSLPILHLKASTSFCENSEQNQTGLEALGLDLPVSQSASLNI